MGTITGSSVAEIEAPLDQVWAIVEDVLSAPEWQGGLKDMLERDRDADGHVTLAESHSDAKVRTIKSTVRFSYEPPTRLRWRQERGEAQVRRRRVGAPRILAAHAPEPRTASRSSSAACSAWSSAAHSSTSCAASSWRRVRASSRRGPKRLTAWARHPSPASAAA